MEPVQKQFSSFAITDEDIERAKNPCIRLDDQEVFDFFQASGKGYQTRINAVLCHYVQQQKALNDRLPK
ncbi:BrnA antitoxin family protein [Rhizobium mongolense]|uniref:Uncharacterized protein (DUF4415 family) n=2 Tax=Rhizobium mongolense TaxID=57676 RepID=A0ABR6INJ2_9HYPH|nr:BrnA antitoxin family protein [Rhizobium mongolense]MBB4229143.1 uncharacterized protein (DUF4415 family) [Rhizobium mongolense]TVZ63303.1 BrnA antitoxin of type II toxin-antitoxin system [Rhizobium mongolense USDA 1844]